MKSIEILEDKLRDIDKHLNRAAGSLRYWQGECGKIEAERDELMDELIQIRTAFDA